MSQTRMTAEDADVFRRRAGLLDAALPGYNAVGAAVDGSRWDGGWLLHPLAQAGFDFIGLVAGQVLKGGPNVVGSRVAGDRASQSNDRPNVVRAVAGHFAGVDAAPTPADQANFPSVCRLQLAQPA